MTCIIVGVEGSERSADAVAFASELARIAHAKLFVAFAHANEGPLVPAGGADDQALVNADAKERLGRMRELAAGVEEVETRAIEDLPPARALQMLADVHQAGLIVIGSSHRGAAGRVLAGTTAERLLHGAPCPVAVVPRGFRERRSQAIRTIGVAYDGGDESRAALHAAVAAARVLGAGVRVVRVHEPAIAPGAAMPVPGYLTPPADLERHAREGLDEAVAGLPADIVAEGVLVFGEAVHELAAQSADLDLLIAGSRGYGPHHAVLAGSVSGRLVRKAACPVVVVPRGVEAAPFERLFASAAGAGAVTSRGS
jgi:nucleotide-binding universal stress UspA family protein